MNTKISKFLIFNFILILSFNFTFAQNVDKKDRGDVTTCKKISQQLWKYKTAKGKAAQDWLVYDVSVLQKVLDKLGYFGEKPEYGENYDIGFYDDSTVEAVKKYQIDNIPWISPSGTVGQKTLDFINKYELCNSDRRFSQLNMDKTYNLPGATFKYPSSDFKPSVNIVGDANLTQRYQTYLDVCNVGEYADADLQKKTLCYKTTRQGSFLGGALLASVIPGSKFSDLCLKPEKGVKDEDVNKSVMINGFSFLEYKTLVKDTGHQTRGDVYRIFKNGKCYEFRINMEVAQIGQVDDDEDLLSSIDQASGKARAAIETIQFTK